jgi:histidinol-phosphate phosphatase family protein
MIRAVLFDRDGTLIRDRSWSPDGVQAMPHAASALHRLRAAGILIGVVTNQPAIAQGIVDHRQLRAIQMRIEEALGSIDGWFVCPHEPIVACLCRKPQPGLIDAACRTFGVNAFECAVVGDIGSDVDAARNAGAHAVLVPTQETLRVEIDAAPVVCANLDAAVDYILSLDAVTVP